MDRQSRKRRGFLSRRGVQGGSPLLMEECIHALLMNCFGQSVCGVGIVKDYYAHRKFNVMEISNTKSAEVELGGEGRVTTTHEREMGH